MIVKVIKWFSSSFFFVDCPGHEAFMNNMLTGTAVMDGISC